MQRNNKIILDQLIKDKPEVIPLIDKYIDMDNIIIKISSGNSILLISNVVMKVYLGEDQTIIEKTKKIYSNLSENLPKLYYCENNIIIMEKLNPIFEKKLLIVDFTNVRKVLMEAAIVLRFFHINGFTHGDPSVHNIGFSTSSNTYLLYDLDDSKKTTDDALFCQDIVDFLESFQIFVSQYVKKIILNDFNELTRQQTGVIETRILNRVRQFPIYKYTYQPDLLIELLNRYMPMEELDNSAIAELKYKKNYLKYKSKYLMLKKRLNRFN